jgi:hypothetical protein
MLTAAIAVIAVELLYFLVTTLFDVRPLNNVRDSTPAEKRQEVIINLPLMAAPGVLLAIGGAVGNPWPGYAAITVQAIILLGGLSLWWMPYLAGITVPWATAGTGATWQELHERTYAQTIIILPRIADRPRPNLEHMILHSIILAGLVLALIAVAGRP